MVGACSGNLINLASSVKCVRRKLVVYTSFHAPQIQQKFFLVMSVLPLCCGFPVSEIQELDSNMQYLVYENHSKFIKASETIREVAPPCFFSVHLSLLFTPAV